METIGRSLIIFGAVIIIVGLLLTFGRNIPLLGRLPGDIFYQRGSVKVYFPIVTSIVISVILTILLNLVVRR